MSTHRRSLPALDRLKYSLRSKIEKAHSPAISQLGIDIGKINEARAKEIIEDVEGYALKKYPELRKLLKCENGHSVKNYSNIQVGLGFESTHSKEIVALKNKLKKEEDEMNAHINALDQWETRCLMSMAAGEGFPEFDMKGIDGL